MSSARRNTVKEAWQGAAAERWLQELTRTDELLQPFGEAAIATLAAQSGEWLLDIGCGAGTPSLELAKLVGAGGGVVGIDVSEPLLARARERARALTHPDSAKLVLVLGDAESHALERSFDAMYSRFGVMFFEHPQRAFAHLRSALKPAGRLAFVCWQTLENNPWAHVPLEAVRALAPERPLPELLQQGLPGPFSLGEELALQQLLSEAGFQHIEITAFERPINLGDSAEAAADYCMRMGPAARFVAEADPSLEPAFRAGLRQALQPHTSARGTWLDAATFVVSARN